MKNLILMLFVVLPFWSCTEASDNNLENCGDTTNVLYEGFSYCGVLKENPKQPSFLIINSNEEVQKLFTTCQTVAVALPDFTQKRILGLFAGPKPTGGYAIKIQAVVEDNCQITVEYFEKEPQKDEIVTTAITYPADYVLLPKSNKPILFKKVKEIVDYVVIGRYSFFCPSNCSSTYRIDDVKTIRFLIGNTTSASYEVLGVKEDFSSFVSHIPQEFLALKGQTKEFKNDLIADGGGCFIEYHQGNVVTDIKFTNFNNPEKGQENLVKFMDYIYSKISFLDASK
ncbi:protease complex subunit PrcB family protein [Flavobacterium sp. ZT3R18]|uniref:protease complex subunit PrcB family protein n=1 Tax=Flavobacterium sp. ZT3R18 TaxID=2594429 RepID=UPI00117AB780|nr:protease complex subunit PrcB family protein [Flavobacterium sp. ZT3R18]TRX36449.1 protease complex subunit PrcB family protein [Flavobacterium sp. ZT3R18]